MARVAGTVAPPILGGSLRLLRLLYASTSTSTSRRIPAIASPCPPSFRCWPSPPFQSPPRRRPPRISTELHKVRARSSADMKRDLVGPRWLRADDAAGFFVLTGKEAKDVAGPAVVLSYVVSGVSAMLSVFCYAEFAFEIPIAGFATEQQQFQQMCAEDQFVIFASDGLWEHLSSQEAVDIVNSLPRNEGLMSYKQFMRELEDDI